MIRVVPAPEPPTFAKKVREPGLRAIAELVGEKPKRSAGRRFTKIADRREAISPDKFPAYWTEVIYDLMEAYSYICAYSCFKIHRVTGAGSVDHMIAKSKKWDHVYEWANYRLACSRMNARKNSFEDVLDPFEIQNGWFQLELDFFQVVPGDALPLSVREAVQDTIDRLGLNDFWEDREHDALWYEWPGTAPATGNRKRARIGGSSPGEQKQTRHHRTRNGHSGTTQTRLKTARHFRYSREASRHVSTRLTSLLNSTRQSP